MQSTGKDVTPKLTMRKSQTNSKHVPAVTPIRVLGSQGNQLAQNMGELGTCRVRLPGPDAADSHKKSLAGATGAGRCCPGVHWLQAEEPEATMMGGSALS